MNIVQTTAIASIAVQLGTALLNIWGLLTPVRPQASIFRSLLFIEFVVQVIELIAYAFLTRLLSRPHHHRQVMTVRYADWAVTTPTMLVTLMAFLSGESSLKAFGKQYKQAIAVILVLDWMMIGFGYIAERSSDIRWVYPGFIAFYILFATIHRAFRRQIRAHREKRFIYAWFLILWALYGIFAIYDFSTRNIGYNVLDVFSKNVTGVFLVWKINENRVTRKARS